MNLSDLEAVERDVEEIESTIRKRRRPRPGFPLDRLLNHTRRLIAALKEKMDG